MARREALGAPPADIDLQARQLLRAVEADIRRHLHIGQLDLEMVGAIYVRIRESILQKPRPDMSTPEDQDRLVNDLALNIFLAVASSGTNASAGPELLPDLRRSLCRALSEGDAVPINASKDTDQRRD